VGRSLLSASDILGVSVKVFIGIMPGAFRALSSSSHSHRLMPASASAFPLQFGLNGVGREPKRLGSIPGVLMVTSEILA